MEICGYTSFRMTQEQYDYNLKYIQICTLYIGQWKKEKSHEITIL